MAEKHLDELAFELIETGIMMNAENILDGVWSGNINTHRIFNLDETPQFINYDVDGSASGLIFTAKGDSCYKMIRENRDCVTIHPMVSCAGQKVLCHVIFSGKEITSKMAPQSAVDKIPNLLISITDHGVQDHKSLLDFYKLFDNKLNECCIERP